MLSRNRQSLHRKALDSFLQRAPDCLQSFNFCCSDEATLLMLTPTTPDVGANVAIGDGAACKHTTCISSMPAHRNTQCKPDRAVMILCAPAVRGAAEVFGAGVDVGGGGVPTRQQQMAWARANMRTTWQDCQNSMCHTCSDGR